MYRPRMREQVDEDAETQDPFNCFEDYFNAFYEEQTSNRIQNCQPSITSGSQRNDATSTRDSSGVSGYEALLRAPTEALSDKLLQLIGQKYSVNTNKTHLQNEVMLARKYVREMTVLRAKKEKEFWQAMYTWKTTTWPNGLSPDDWREVRREDLAAYDA
ncbi:Hypothetical predicted protein [Paramuricea clavata]|uniref:Uncharacterized protein n=1 Tax=Paramuricea clavata TaxID=317549 RepID=A0A6S7GME4_PARCT|nr:Hypothetical predicted protein [Paramuricea clavata]